MLLVDFEYLINFIRPTISHKNINVKKDIGVYERLSATLKFLVTGVSYWKCTIFYQIIELQQLAVFIFLMSDNS